MGKGIGGHTKPFKGESDIWLTPPHVLESFPCFDLDPCGHKGWATAKRMYYPPQDGLALPWFGMVWLNPPYGPQAEKWLHRLSQHGRGIALIFARTDTVWWHREVAEKSHSVLFLEGRLFFHRADGIRAKHNSGGPSALVAYGEEAGVWLSNCTLQGWLIENKNALLASENIAE